MKKSIVLIIAAILLTSCTLPVSVTINTPSSPTAVVSTPPAEATPIVVTVTNPPAVSLPTATSDMTGQAKNLGGVQFFLPQCLASDANGVIIPEENPGADMPLFAYNPEYRKITLTGYPLPKKFWEQVIQIYPVARFTELVPSLVDHVSEMQQVLANKPANYANSIPVLPIMGAAQLFKSHIEYINFQNGQGVGFITEYAQYPAPVNNTDMFYTYQGLSADEKYWISVILPINAAYLQPSNDNPTIPADGIAPPDMNSATYAEDTKAYYVQMTQKLDSTSGDAFTPTIPCISQLIQSINIGD